MRAMAYVVAALAAVGIMIGIASLPESASETAPPSAATATSAAADARVMDQPGSLVLSVPTMHCEFACYPRVKEILEQSDGVESVALAEQQEEGVIDNRAVVVSYDAGFNLDAAIASLNQRNFPDANLQDAEAVK